MSEARTFASVSRVQARLRKLLEPALDAKPFWLRAELSSVSRTRNGALYCDLVEMQGGRVSAKLRCTIWGRDLTRIQKKLEDAGVGDVLQEGREVGLRCAIEYHELYGLSVRAVDIDPSESLGALERKKQEIIARLRKEALLDCNAEYEVPELPQKIALVASRGTAGYQDFVTTLQNSGFSLQIYAADARVEGEHCEASVLRALSCVEKLDVDVVVLLRGGGSRLSLSYFDNEAIARKIAGFTKPVWTAIGHEIDTAVVDFVAHTSFKTPTAAAEHIVARFVEASEFLQGAAYEIRQKVEYRLQPQRQWLDRSGSEIIASARRAIREKGQAQSAARESFRLQVSKRLTAESSGLEQSRQNLVRQALQRKELAQRTLDEHRKSLHKTVGRNLDVHRERALHLRERLTAPTALNRIRHEKQRCDSWRQVLRIADPARNLERGYALIYDDEGALVRGVSQLAPEQTLRVELGEGAALVRVESTESKE